MKARKTLKAVDFFCGGGGMSYGMQKAGVKVIAGIDCDNNCKETYEANIVNAKFINADVFNLKEKELAIKLNLTKEDDNLILIGCSPCQFWSIINTNKTKSAQSKNLLVEFHRFVKYLKPGFVVVENVPGVLRKKGESGLADFISWLEKNKYVVHFEVHNTNDYGVPQNRKRFTLIANRVNQTKVEPDKSKGSKPALKDFIGFKNGFPTVQAGHKDSSTFIHTVAGLSDVNMRRLSKVKKDGGNRFDFANDPELQLQCFVGKENSFRDTFGRLSWDKPSSTITTKFFNISCGRFAHPEENRGLSLREGATLQTFPKNYIFKGSGVGVIAKLIGNAVPPAYSECIGRAIINAI